MFIEGYLKYTVTDGKSKTVAACGCVSGTPQPGLLTLPATVKHGGETFSVTSVADRAFVNCIGITGIAFPDSIARLGRNSFSYCTSLVDVIIPRNVKAIESGCFAHCSNLTRVSLPEGLETIGDEAFAGCGSLSAVKLPSTLKTIRANAFAHCRTLKKAALPSGLQKIEAQAFFDCDIDVARIPASVSHIGCMAFSLCRRLKEYVVEDGNTKFVSKDGVLFNNTQKILISYPCGRGGQYVIPDGVKIVGSAAFCYCKGVEAIDIPASVNYISERAFTSSTIIRITNRAPKPQYLGAKAIKSLPVDAVMKVPAGSLEAYQETDWKYLTLKS